MFSVLCTVEQNVKLVEVKDSWQVWRCILFFYLGHMSTTTGDAVISWPVR